MKKLLENNLGLKIVSLIIAVFLWYMLIEYNDPIISQSFSVPVQVTNTSYIATGKKTYRIDEAYRNVTVIIRDNKTILNEIKEDDITATADLTQIVDMNTDPVYVPIHVTCAGVNSAKITPTTATIPVSIEDVEQETFPVTVDYGTTKPNKDYDVGTAVSTPENITISGPASIVNKIGSIMAEIDVTDMSTDGKVPATLKIIDKNGDQVGDASVVYLGDLPDVTVDVTLWKKQSAVKLKADYSGTPKDGYQVSSISVSPSEVTVAGSAAALQELSANANTITIPADKINVNNASADVEQTVDLSSLLPDEMKLTAASGTTTLSKNVTVKVAVLPKGSREYEYDVENVKIFNLTDKLAVSYDQPQLFLRIKATDADLDAFDGSKMIAASIDLKDKQKGDYTVPVQIILPTGYELVEDVTTTIHINTLAEAETSN
ncbi:MAG: CdaR family protein [Lachnospiraceae bacterium]|nr:CdaR family protein [Lachnospiraceae bacterium]